MKTGSNWAAGIILTAGLLYGLLWPRYDVGCYHDDALYILGARSLLQGRYVNLHLPQEPPLNDPLPGFPLALAPFVHIVQPHWSILKAVPILLLLLSGVLIWKLFAAWLPPWPRLWVLALTLTNPLVVNFSGTVMAEPCFLFFSLMVFWGVQQVLTGREDWPALGLGLLLGWASVLRPQGIVLIPSVALGLAYGQRWKGLIRVTSLALCIWGAVLLRNYLVVHSPWGYWHLWIEPLTRVGTFDALRIEFVNSLHALQMFVTDTISPVPFVGSGWETSGFRWLWIFLISSLGFFGFAGLSGRGRVPEGLALAIGTFCFLLLETHVLTGAIDVRYFLPLVPFALGFLALGVQGLTVRWPSFRWPAVAGAIALAITYGVQDGKSLYEAYHRPLANRMPWQTFSWIQAHVPREDALLASGASTIYLYTGRHATYDLPARNAQEFQDRLRDRTINYVMFRFLPVAYVHSPLTHDPAVIWAHRYDWVLALPQTFTKVFENDAEASVVYRVTADKLRKPLRT